ncbi:MOSC domain-containing protein [Deinococcus multiflagellatus]|uniref:MOSC domain-containing protein n=1 Tax=Deinococcus multiflagellatus TaxID=1656887 RepID=A0ABW1ZMB2_9DEIO|nr:MOSC N-terminal beta barrel domain-containing protein [Deinococcus multiflagellatus]MBZ9713916.1 MOSC N-terminal beta barrel domain-containing protein [Deinococcus multiflagellatus]
MSHVGHVAQLYRYPIKSVGGEALTQVAVNERGFEGDRWWAVEDENGKFGSGKSTRRFRRMEGLLDFRAALPEGAAEPMLTLPGGETCAATSPQATAALRERTGHRVTVTPEREISHFDEGALHLLTTSALAWLAQAHGAPVASGHFRHNLLLDTGPVPEHLEERWLGRQLAIGDTLTIQIAAPMPRCVMVNMAQPGVPADPGLLKTIATLHPDACFGVLAQVVQPGILRLGDAARLL